MKLRRVSPVLRDRARKNPEVLGPNDGMIQLLFGKTEAERYLVQVDLIGGRRPPPLERSQDWQLILGSNEKRFGGDDSAPFAQPEVRVFQSLGNDL